MNRSVKPMRPRLRRASVLESTQDETLAREGEGIAKSVQGLPSELSGRQCITNQVQSSSRPFGTSSDF